MASLALLVGLIFIVVLLSGPICFILSKISIIPNWTINILAVITILTGIWWLCLPIGPIKYVGILTIWLGFLSMRSKVERA